MFDQYFLKIPKDIPQDFYLRPTSSEGLPTDISQDFSLYRDNVTELQIPEGAHRILFSADDVHFSNNIDRDGDYGAYVRYHVPITDSRCVMEESESE